jgi:hypothetical protein
MANTSEARNVIIRNVTLFWAKLDKPVSPFGTEQYEIQLRVPKKRAKELEPFGTVKETDNGMVSINLKKKAFKADGSPAAKVDVVDTAKQPVDPKKIGNGSEGNVMVMLRDYEIKAPNGKVTRSGTSVMLNKVQVTKLVEFKPSGGGDFVDFDYESTSEALPEDAEF